MTAIILIILGLVLMLIGYAIRPGTHMDKGGHNDKPSCPRPRRRPPPQGGSGMPPAPPKKVDANIVITIKKD